MLVNIPVPRMLWDNLYVRRSRRWEWWSTTESTTASTIADCTLEFDIGLAKKTADRKGGWMISLTAICKDHIMNQSVIWFGTKRQKRCLGGASKKWLRGKKRPSTSRWRSKALQDHRGPLPSMDSAWTADFPPKQVHSQKSPSWTRKIAGWFVAATENPSCYTDESRKFTLFVANIICSFS